jgi:hypothetical protein
MGAARSETYARFRDGNPPRLLLLKPKASAKIVKVITKNEGRGRPKNNPTSVEGYDIIYNEAYDKHGKRKYREWIILNPDAVEDFTADPEAMRPILENELRKLKIPRFHYPEEDLFYTGVENKAAWKRSLEGVLESGKGGIPQFFLRPCPTCKAFIDPCDRIYGE